MASTPYRPKLNPQERGALTKQLRRRAVLQAGLSQADRTELRRRADNLEKVTAARGRKTPANDQ
jgi:hypothetical protein